MILQPKQLKIVFRQVFSIECLKTGNWLKEFSIVYLKSGKSLTGSFRVRLKAGNWLKEFSIVCPKSGKGLTGSFCVRLEAGN